MLRTLFVALCLLGLAASAAPAAVLYDNGPLVTNPGAGAGGADVSGLQTLVGESTYGYGIQVGYGYRGADDFEISDPGGWNINSILLYAYQTGTGTASTITAANLRIWNNVPDGSGSTLLFGDVTTNRLVSSAWSGIYRTMDTSLGSTDRPIMECTVAASIFLGPGHYWMDWSMDGDPSLAGPWCPPTSYLGLTNQPWANAMQYTTAWASIIDGGSQTPDDLPFKILSAGGGVVPEPAPLALFAVGLGLVAVAGLRRR
jgi:hypothetical protein